MSKFSEEAAKAFYAQKEPDFTAQVQQITASDPRLAAIFEKTRQRYMNGTYATKKHSIVAHNGAGNGNNLDVS